MVLKQHLNVPFRINKKENSFGITNLFALSTHLAQMAPNWRQYEIWPIIWTFTYKTSLRRFIFLTVKEIIYCIIHTWLTVTTAGHQKEAEVTRTAYILHYYFQSIMSITHWQYFCDIFSSYIFNMRISNLTCFHWYKSMRFFFISSKYAPQHV